jgi:hypothetical protein
LLKKVRNRTEGKTLIPASVAAALFVFNVTVPALADGDHQTLSMGVQSPVAA